MQLHLECRPSTASKHGRISSANKPCHLTGVTDTALKNCGDYPVAKIHDLKNGNPFVVKYISRETLNGLEIDSAFPS